MRQLTKDLKLTILAVFFILAALLPGAGLTSAAYPPLSAAGGKPAIAAHGVSLENGKVELALHVLALGKTIEAVRIDNLGGVSSLWRSDGKDGGAPLAVSQGGASLSSGAQAMSFTAGDAETLLSLSLKDNGAFAGKNTGFRVTVFFAGGERAMCALEPDSFPAAVLAQAGQTASTPVVSAEQPVASTQAGQTATTPVVPVEQPAASAQTAPTASAPVVPAEQPVAPVQTGQTASAPVVPAEQPVASAQAGQPASTPVVPTEQPVAPVQTGQTASVPVVPAEQPAAPAQAAPGDADAAHAKQIENLLLHSLVPGQQVRIAGIAVKGDTVTVRGLTVSMQMKTKIAAEKAAGAPGGKPADGTTGKAGKAAGKPAKETAGKPAGKPADGTGGKAAGEPAEEVIVGNTEISIDEIVCTGVDFAAMDTPGVRRLLATARIAGYTAKTSITGTDPKTDASFGSQQMSVRAYSIDGVYGDLMAMRQAATKAQAAMTDGKEVREENIDAFVGLLRSLLSFRFDAASMEELTIAYPMGSVTIHSATGRDFSLFHSGPAKMEGITVEIGGQKMLHIDAVGIASQRFGDLVTPFLAADIKKLAQDEEAKKFLHDNLDKFSFAMEGMYMTGVRTLMPELGDNSLGRLSGSLAVSFPEMKWEAQLEDLKLSPQAYASFGPQGQALAGIYKNSLQFSGGLRLTAANRADGGTIDLQELRISESNLGSATFAMKLAYAPGFTEMLSGANAPKTMAATAEQSNLLLKDKGIGDLAVALSLVQQGQQPEANVIAAVRGQWAQMVRQAMADPEGKYAKKTDALAQFAAQSGTLSWVWRPSAPIPLEQVAASFSLKDLEVQYNPPAQQTKAPTPNNKGK